ncbi:MAG: uracil-DNA glycosylase [Gallionella sp.]|nr:uracil-DNA glycosylase [Gallionella sp.]
MDRNEAVLRELKLYPLWRRRGAPAPVAAVEVVQEAQASDYAAPPRPAQPDVGRALARHAPSELVEAVGLKPDLQHSPVSRGGELSNINWPELKQQVRDCTLCKLRAGCTQTVFGVGDEQAEWLFVGEGPGADEDAQGEPFVGQAGKLLDNMLLAIGLRRGKNVYIANIVKCRPPNNRAPEADEIATCLPYLQRQIELIKPRLIVALGKTAATALLGRDAPLGSLRGTLHDYHGIPLVITYHPAYLLRSPMEKAKAWQDLCLAMRARHGEA